jgi:hypothetical protein
VVLREHDELGAVEAGRGGAVAAPAEGRLAAVVDVSLAERLRDVVEPAEVDVVVVALAGASRAGR